MNEGCDVPMQLNPNATPREKMADFLGAYTIHLNGGELKTRSFGMQEIYDKYKTATLDQFESILKSELAEKDARIRELGEKVAVLREGLRAQIQFIETGLIPDGRIPRSILDVPLTDAINRLARLDDLQGKP